MKGPLRAGLSAGLCCGAGETQARHSSGSTCDTTEAAPWHNGTERIRGTQSLFELGCQSCAPLTAHDGSPALRALLEGCSESGTVTVPSWRDALPGTGQRGWGGSDPSPRSQPRARDERQPPLLPKPRGCVTCPGIRAGRAAAFAELLLETWDLHCDRNGREHRTADMGCKQLVVRRGQPFAITLRFSGRGYEEGVDKLAFNVATGECRHICVAREGCVGVTTLCPCPRAHLCSHGGCATAPAPCHTVPVPCLAEAGAVHSFYVRTGKKSRNSSP